MENLARVLRNYHNVNGIDGVMYVHDDAIPVMKYLSLGNQYPFPTSDIITTFDSEVIFTMYPNSTESNFRGHHSFSLQELQDVIVKEEPAIQAVFPDGTVNVLYWTSSCLSQFIQAMTDPRAGKYISDKNGGVTFRIKEQTDFLFIPSVLANEFADAAEWLSDSNVFLECAGPSLVQQMQSHNNATVRNVKLCTHWLEQRKDLLQFLPNLSNDSESICNIPDSNYTLYHPIKLSIGLQNWGKAFDKLNELYVPK